MTPSKPVGRGFDRHRCRRTGRAQKTTWSRSGAIEGARSGQRCADVLTEPNIRARAKGLGADRPEPTVAPCDPLVASSDCRPLGPRTVRANGTTATALWISHRALEPHSLQGAAFVRGECLRTARVYAKCRPGALGFDHLRSGAEHVCHVPLVRRRRAVGILLGRSIGFNLAARPRSGA